MKYTICESTAVNGMLAWKAIAWQIVIIMLLK